MMHKFNMHLKKYFFMMQADRQKTAGLIPTLMNEVSEQLHNNFSLIRLSREMEFQESDEFRSLLGMRKSLLIIF